MADKLWNIEHKSDKEIFQKCQRIIAKHLLPTAYRYERMERVLTRREFKFGEEEFHQPNASFFGKWNGTFLVSDACTDWGDED